MNIRRIFNILAQTVELFQVLERDEGSDRPNCQTSLVIAQTSIVKTRHTATQPSSGVSLQPTRHMYCIAPPPIWYPTPSRRNASFAVRIGQQMVPLICLSSFNNRSLWLLLLSIVVLPFHKCNSLPLGSSSPSSKDDMKLFKCLLSKWF